MPLSGLLGLSPFLVGRPKPGEVPFPPRWHPPELTLCKGWLRSLASRRRENEAGSDSPINHQGGLVSGEPCRRSDAEALVMNLSRLPPNADHAASSSSPDWFKDEGACPPLADLRGLVLTDARARTQRRGPPPSPVLGEFGQVGFTMAKRIEQIEFVADHSKVGMGDGRRREDNAYFVKDMED